MWVNPADLKVIGITRTYMSRHGAGPFVTEDSSLAHPEKHNTVGPWQGEWRTGYLDGAALQYAVDACGGIDGLYVTHTDVPVTQVCARYRLDGKNFSLNRLPAFDLEARRRRSRTLAHVQPQYLPVADRFWEHVLPYLLGTELYGYGWGPAQSEGVFV